MPITKADVMALVRDACPSFREPWAAYVASSLYDEDLLYIHLGELADHLVGLVRAGATAELPAVFEVVERMHVDGDPYVQEAATIGLLEGLQNLAANRGLDPDTFVPYLQLESARWWAELDRSWGKAVPVGGSEGET